MAFSATTLQPTQPVSAPVKHDPLPDFLFSMILMSAYGTHISKKAMRKLRRQFLWTSLKLKARKVFKPRDVSDKTLRYLLIAAALLLLLLITSVEFVLVLALIVLILILLGII